MTTHYYLGGSPLGSTTTRQTWDGVNALAAALAYCCPHCGDIWARAHTTHLRQWHFVITPCPKHPTTDPYRPAGSFLLSWNPTQLQELPDEVLTHEFTRLYTHHQEEIECPPPPTLSLIPRTPNSPDPMSY